MNPPDRTLLAVVGALSAGAGAVHLGLAADHAAHHWSMGAAFLVAGWAQLGWALALWLRFGRGVLVAGVALQLGALAALGATLRWGWPVGPLAGQPEALTTPAVLCAGLEVAAVAMSASLLLDRVRLPAAALPVAVAGVLACASAAIVLAAPEPAGSDHHGTTTAAALLDTPATDHHAEPPTAAAGAGAPPAPGGHGHGPVDTTPPTPEQQAAADKLLRETRAALKRYEVASVAEAEGYYVTHDAGGKLLHYGHKGYRNDGRTLDPKRIESLLYVVLPGGGKLLVGGMYTMPLGERGPQIGGSLTQWHGHDDLCIDAVKGIAITQAPGGGCPPGSAVAPTGEMMHVWSIEYPGGPFGELDPMALRQAVMDHYGLESQS